MKRELRKQYVVTKRNKNIFAIAGEVYGNAGMAGKILRENPGVYELKAGMVLNLPVDVPQKPVTADQAMRLDFAGLNDYTFEEQSSNEFDGETSSEVRGTASKEQIARSLLDFLKGIGFLDTFEELVEGASPAEGEKITQSEAFSDERGEQTGSDLQENMDPLGDLEGSSADQGIVEAVEPELENQRGVGQAG